MPAGYKIQEVTMTKRETTISLPELGMVAGTRIALGAGIGLLLAGRLNDDQRKAVGFTLLLVGLVSTIPLGIEVFIGGRLPKQAVA